MKLSLKSLAFCLCHEGCSFEHRALAAYSKQSDADYPLHSIVL
jgi:hypothetical protein